MTDLTQLGDAVAAAHSDPDLPPRRREMAATPHLPRHPLQNDPDRSVYDDIGPTPTPTDRAWWESEDV